MHKKRALVIGGTKGIGKAISIMLAHRGMQVIVHGGHDAQALNELLHTLKPNAEGFLSADSPEHLCETIRDYLPLDLICVGFGPFTYASLAETQPSQWRLMTEWNLLLPGLIISTLAPSMSTNGGGTIIVFGADLPERQKRYKKIAGYAATKAGLQTLVRSAAVEFGPEGIHVYGIYPDFVETEMIDASTAELWTKLSVHGKLLSGEEVARVLNWMLDAPPMLVNGMLIPVWKTVPFAHTHSFHN